MTSATCSRMPIMRAAASIAGSDASDERVEMATLCGAIIALSEPAEADAARQNRDRITGKRYAQRR